MRSLRVTNDGQEGARVYMGPNSDFSVGTDAGGNFVIARGGHPEAPPIFAIDKNDNLAVRSKSTQVRNLDVSATGGVVINGVNQWRLLRADDFSVVEGASGWSRPEVTQCAGVSMLGGFCRFSKGEVKKKFTDLPAHTHLRIQASYHFIDRWIGEAGFMKLSIGVGGAPAVVWSEQHTQEMSTNGVSICGQGTPEGKFAVPIDVTVPHTASSVELIFGSTMEDMDPCDESWGISNVELYVRG